MLLIAIVTKFMFSMADSDSSVKGKQDFKLVVLIILAFNLPLDCILSDKGRHGESLHLPLEHQLPKKSPSW